MLPLFISIAAVASLVGYAIKRGGRSAYKEEDERKKLAHLEMRTVLTLDEAEDGLVLSRKYGHAESQRKFGAAVTRLKKNRPKV